MWLFIFIIFICFNFYLFPVEFDLLPGINTKMVLALLGCLQFLYKCIVKQISSFNQFFISIFLLACLVSLAGFISITLNDTYDTSYATYIVSMVTWISAAYFVVGLMSRIHKKLSFEIVAFYFVAACFFQCLIALVIDFLPSFKSIVDLVFNQNETFLNKDGRLYGIGASLDTAGIRFALCLILLIHLMNRIELSDRAFRICVFAFIVIFIVGAMIARTTIVGFVLGGVLLLIYRSVSIKKVLIVLSASLFFFVLGWYLYNTNSDANEMIRFGLEPFFNYFGDERTFLAKSNENLLRMYIWPDNMKTWIIGDGYFNNPNTTDPYYLGQTTSWGYYMGTDVGYCRLIFYFGLTGLMIFTSFLLYSTKILFYAFNQHKYFFLFCFICGLFVWLKVSTDVFFVFAPWLCLMSFKKENEKIL